MISICHQLVGQVEIATIQTSYEFNNKQLNFNIRVNGVDVSKTNMAYSIPINQVGFDTIEFSLHNNPTGFAIMKMRQNETYELKSNCCSMYVIQPKEEPKQGMVKFRIENKDTTYFNVDVDGLSKRKINRESIDKFCYTPPSALCPFQSYVVRNKS